ncbi:MAG: hypothetical protein JSV70_08310 [bacterium]|nr:MAG: hypothetical protein JSV70_08310 [bacterium]
MPKALIVTIVLLTAVSSSLAMSTSDCFDCHSDDTLTKVVRGNEVSLFIDEEIYGKSAHGELDCTDCHEDLAGLEDEHGEELKPVQCSNCHDDAAEEMTAAEHPAECSDCHGKHDILPPSDSRSSVYDLNVPGTCCTCHSEQETPDVCVQYESGMHGMVLLRSGMIFSAVCNDCHGSHDIRGAGDPESMIARANINDTCAACHKGVVETYRQSIHGEIFRDSPEDAPVCTSCHSAHDTERAMDDAFLITVVKRCSTCHEEMGYTFSKNYHGQVTGMGYTRAAQCPDCHGAHDILSRDDPESMVHPDNLVATCGKCHPGANRNFTMYMPHADYHDAQRYPMLYYVYLAMVILLTGTFAFFGIHTLLWFIRAYLENLRNRSGGAH